MFTEKFLKVPIKLYDSNNEEYTGKKHFARVLPSQIAFYYPSSPNGQEELTCTKVDMKACEGPLVWLPILEFEDLLNKFTAENAIS